MTPKKDKPNAPRSQHQTPTDDSQEMFPPLDIPDSDDEQELPDPPAQWDVDAHLPRLERESSTKVTQEHLILALDHVGALLNANGYKWAVMGGLAMLMHGNTNRTTRDVDLAVETRPRDAIMALRDTRIYTPPLLSMAGSGCGRFYVLTGPEYGDNVSSQIVEVDLIMTGYLGAPKTLSDATVTRTAATEAGQRTYDVLSVPQLCKAKLHALNQREAERDLADLEWLCVIFPPEIQAIADTFDEEERFNFLDKYRAKYPGKAHAIKTVMAVLRLEAPADLEDQMGALELKE